MQLHDLKHGDWFMIEGADDTEYVFDRLDGMYSVCYDCSHINKIVHLAVWTPVKLVEKTDGNDA